MKIKVHVKDVPPEPVKIQGTEIRLDAFLKFAGALGTGGQAKMVIQGGEVFVNRVVCTARSKKLRHGDHVKYDGQAFEVIADES